MASIPASTAIEPVTGWRTWNLSVEADGPALWPAGSGVDPWPHRRPVEARCAVPAMLRRHRGVHRAPAEDCRCGVYAARSLDDIRRERPAWPPAPVIGTASLWGTTIDHERGWRSRWAYPSRLRLACTLCAWVEPGPGTADVVHSFLGRLYPFCDEHAGGIELPGGRRTRPAGLDPTILQSQLLDAYAVDLLPLDPIVEFCRRPAAAEVPAYIPAIRSVPLGAS